MEPVGRWWDAVRGYRPAAWGSLVAGLACALAAVYLIAVRTGPGQAADVRAFSWVSPLHDLANGPAERWRAAAPVLLAAVVAGCALHAWRARRRRRVVAGLLGVAAALPAATVLRDELLARPWLGDHGYAHNTLPSGHVAVVTALAAAVLLLWPATGVPRGAVVTATGVVAATAAASVVTYAHRPSDVVAGLLLGLLAPALACWAVRPPLPAASPRADLP